MAATVTTPIAVQGAITNPVVPASSLFIVKVFADAFHLAIIRITATGVQHLTIAPPVMRWNGTTWATLYRPTA